MPKAINVARLFIEIVAAVFFAEAAVMLILPLFASGLDELIGAFVDAGMLSLLAGPVILWRVRRAIRVASDFEAPDLEESRKSNAAAAVAALAVGLLLTSLAVAFVVGQIRSESRERFDHLAERIVLEAERRVQLPLNVLKGARGVYTASESVERAEFRAMVDSRNLTSEFPGVVGIGFIEHVHRPDVAAFVAHERADGAPDFNVRSSGNHEDLWIVKYIDPLESNRQAWGWDAGADPVRLEAIQRAVATGEPALSGPVVLPQDPKMRTGFLYLLPIFRNGTHPQTADERRECLVGLIYAPIVAEEVFAGISESSDGCVDLDVFDGTDIASANLVYDLDGKQSIKGQEADWSVMRGKMYWQTRSIQIGGRKWTLSLNSTPQFESSITQTLPIVLALGGTILSLLLATVIWTLGSARSRAITLAHGMTADLKHATALADAANRAKSEFLANMSHEIRTPLTAILGYSDLLKQDQAIANDPHQRSQMLDTIGKAGRHLLTVINDVLDLSKIEAGKMTVETVETPLIAILHEVESLMRPRASVKGLTLSTNLRTPLPDNLLSDPTRLRQILLNLAGNAVKFTEAGTVRVEAGRSDDGTSDVLVIDIIDTGPGISAADHARLFAPFCQADSTVTRRYGGTGLGLTICHRLAKLMGGSVTLLSSTPNEGSTFRLRLPLIPTPAAQWTSSLLAVNPQATPPGTSAEHRVSDPKSDGGNPLPPLKQTGSRPSQPAVALSARILLAEDGPDNQRLISFHLRRAGATVEIADNGQIALDMIHSAIARNEPYDLLLTDMQMPILDGYSLARTLRAAHSTIPIIALTAHAMSEDQTRCLQAGCDGYATKPIDPTALVQLCQRWSGTTSPRIAA